MRGFHLTGFLAVLGVGCGAFHYTEKVEVPDPYVLLDPEVADLARDTRISYTDIVGKRWTGDFMGVSDSTIQVDVTSVALPGTSLGKTTKRVLVAPGDMQDVSLVLEATETNRSVDAAGGACGGIGSMASTVGSCIYFSKESEEKGDECIPYNMETLATGFMISLFLVLPVAAGLFLLLGAGIAAQMAPKDEIMEAKKRAEALREKLGRGPGQ